MNTSSALFGLVLIFVGTISAAFAEGTSPVCVKPSVSYFMRVDNAAKDGFPEFQTPPGGKTQYYLKKIVTFSSTDICNFTSTCPAYDSGQACGHTSLPGPATTNWNKTTSNVGYTHECDKYTLVKSYSNVTGGGVINSTVYDYREYTYNVGGACTNPRYHVYYRDEVVSGGGNFTLGPSGPQWTGTVSTSNTTVRDCPPGEACSNVPAVGRMTIVDGGTSDYAGELIEGGAVTSPTTLLINASGNNYDCGGAVKGSWSKNGSTTLSNPFTTRMMIDIAKERATATAAEVAAGPWVSVGSAYTFMNDAETSVEVRRMWFVINVPTEAPVEYVVTWKQVFVSLDAGVSIVEHSTSVTGTGGYVATQLFMVEPPDSNGFIYITDVTACPVGATLGSCESPIAANSANCCGGAGEVGDGPFLGGAGFSLSLGETDFGRIAGTIRYNQTVPSELSFKTSAFSVVGKSTDTDVIVDASGSLIQAKSRQYLVHFRQVSAARVALHVFPTAQIGAKAGGVYPTNGATELVMWLIEAPMAPQANYLQTLMTEYTGPANGKVTQFDYEPIPRRWTMLAPGGLSKIRQTSTWVPNGNPMTGTLTVTREALDPQTSSVLESRKEVYSVSGEMNGDNARMNLVKLYVGIGADEKMSEFWYDAVAGRKNLDRDWSGKWYKTDWDNMPRPTTRWEAYGPYSYEEFNLNPQLCRRTTYSYQAVDADNDDGTVGRYVPRTETESVLGVVVRQTKRVVHSSAGVVDWVKEYQLPYENAALDDPAALITTTRYLTSGFFAGRVKSVLYPDQTMAFYTYADASGTRTTTVERGQPNAEKSAIVAGTTVVTVVSQDGRLMSNTTRDFGSSQIVDQKIYSNFDTKGRAQTVTFLDETTESYSYGCCRLDSFTARDGTVTTYGYDSLKRRISSTTAGVTVWTDYDWAGNIFAVRRQGTDGSIITLSQNHYNTAGELDSTVNQLGATTTYTETLVGGLRTRSVTEAVSLPEQSTRVETYYPAGDLKEVVGTGAQPVRYEYGIESDDTSPDYLRTYTKTIRLSTSGGVNEWTKSYVDFLGRRYKTLYADANTPNNELDNPVEMTGYNNLGQLTSQTDADGVTTLFRYNGQGQLEVTATDVNKDGLVANYDPGILGNDRVTSTTTLYLATGAPGNTRGMPIRKTESAVWTTESSAATNKVQTMEVSLNGLNTWTSSYRDQSTPVTSRSVTAYLGSGNRTVSSYNPDGSYAVQNFANGRLSSVVLRDSGGAQVGSTTYQYDPHGRQWRIVDARNGTTTLLYKAGADLVETVTTPVPGTGQSAQSMTSIYDNLQRVKQVTQPDGTVVNKEYFPTGLLKKTYGSRTYPVEYTYDTQGRMKTMKTWQDYAGNSSTAITTWNYNIYRGWLDNKRYQDGKGPDYEYTAGGRLKKRFWARANGGNRVLTTYTYGFDDRDAQNQLIPGNEFADLMKIAYTYDPANTPDVTFTYDRRGRRFTGSFGAMTTTYGYTDAGPLTSEAHSGPGSALAGLTVTTGYDTYLRRNTLGANMVTALSQSFAYDTAGRPATATDGAYSATYGYAVNSRLISNVTSKEGATTRLTVTRSYDFLNRLQSVQASPNAVDQPPNYNAYDYNNANQRRRQTMGDGSYWVYTYDALGQVTSGKRYWNEGTPVAGQQFEYTFDDIGNRKTTKSGGDAAGSNLRSASYTPNLLNQYTRRDTPSTFDVLGLAAASATVTVNSSSSGVYRRGEYFRKEVTVNNATAPVWQSVSVSAGGTATTGNMFVAKDGEDFGKPSDSNYPGYDADGNLLRDGRWKYTWDAENRLKKMEPVDWGTIPAGSRLQMDFEYDLQGRRTRKKVTNLDTSLVVSETRFLYDGWNVIAELSGASGTTPVRTYLWGTDLSGTWQGAGGVGGLLAMKTSAGVAHFANYDGNGNVTLLVDGSSGIPSAAYEYGPFGELIRGTGAQAKTNPFRFSTKYTDDETGRLNYGYRYYNAGIGRWTNRDPLGEVDSSAINVFLNNDPVNTTDVLGLAKYDIEIVSGLDKYFPGPKGEGEWAQPFYAGSGRKYGEGRNLTGRNSGYSFVDLDNGYHLSERLRMPTIYCNTVRYYPIDPDDETGWVGDAGAIRVYLKDRCVGHKYRITIEYDVRIAGAGPARKFAQIYFWKGGWGGAGSDQFDRFEATRESPVVTRNRQVVIEVDDRGSDWDTPIFVYQPVLGLRPRTKDGGQSSYTYAETTVTVVSIEETDTLGRR